MAKSLLSTRQWTAELAHRYEECSLSVKKQSEVKRSHDRHFPISVSSCLYPPPHYLFIYTPYFFKAYFSPIPLLTASLPAILSTHFNRCGNSFISSSAKPVIFHPLTQGQVPISAMLYLPLPLPARYSRGSPVYLPDRRISRTPKTRRVSLWKRFMASEGREKSLVGRNRDREEANGRVEEVWKERRRKN